jgi:hypothetical protein
MLLIPAQNWPCCKASQPHSPRNSPSSLMLRPTLLRYKAQCGNERTSWNAPTMLCFCVFGRCGLSRRPGGRLGRAGKRADFPRNRFRQSFDMWVISKGCFSGIAFCTQQFVICWSLGSKASEMDRTNRIVAVQVPIPVRPRFLSIGRF